jgi:single-stranded DNA-binding protein
MTLQLVILYRKYWLKSIGNNKFVCNFSVATSEEWLDKATKQKKQKTEWHNISVFGKLAEIASKSDAASTAGVVTFTVFLGALPSVFLSKN